MFLYPMIVRNRKKSVRFTIGFNFIKLTQCFRNISGISCWDRDLNTDVKIKIEKHWKEYVLNGPKLSSDNTNYYVLPMFPYPSGNLHMGHVRVYSISDAIARFQKLSGKNVIHPIGWDAFGLPAENAAIEHNIPPDQWTSANIETMKNQLLQLGCNFDWNRELSTCDPSYYKWTQYIFLKLYEQGLAYQNKSLVNWDPVDQTVLADEQVDSLGCSWRSGAKVEKKILEQWFLRTTKFAKQLYDGLSDTTLENWKDIINLQEHWIGYCNGITVTFDLTPKDTACLNTVDIWSSEPYKFLHGQFLCISKNHVIVQGLKGNHNDCMLPIWAVNPINNTEMSIYVTDDIEYPEGRDIHIACPSVCAKDAQIATKLNIPFANNSSVIINESNVDAIEIAQSKKVGGHLVSSKLKDWLISRQRYWGTPIPIIHCDKCGTVPVPYSELPVTLPMGNGVINLDKVESWVNCRCPCCDSRAKRETDTMDTFVDSSWYFYRYLDPHNEEFPFDKSKLTHLTPVDMYVGGKEHAVLHLYYARFMSYFLHSLGWTNHPEPFKRLLVQGMVMGQSYRVKSSGKYVPASAVEKDGKEYKMKTSGEAVDVQWEKMSKSKYNGESPERLLAEYGCDTTRLFMLSDVPPVTSRHWSEATFPGGLNWQRRIWKSMQDLLKCRRSNIYQEQPISREQFDAFERNIRDKRNYYIGTTTYNFRHTQQLSVGISRLQSLTSTLRNNLPPEVIAKSKEYELALACLIIMLHPVTPHFSSELWSGLQSAENRVNVTTPLIEWDKDVLDQKWPIVDDDYGLSLMCKVDGKDMCKMTLKRMELNKLTFEEALQLVLSKETVANRVKSGIMKSQFDLFPDCRGILYLYTNRSIKKEKELLEIKIN